MYNNLDINIEAEESQFTKLDNTQSVLALKSKAAQPIIAKQAAKRQGTPTLKLLDSSQVEVKPQFLQSHKISVANLKPSAFEVSVIAPIKKSEIVF